MAQKFCQSCGMPLKENCDLFGTESDGSPNQDYCVYCYKEGKFTFNGSMDEMISICVPHVVEAHKDMSEEAAREMMRKFLPNLKRWSTDQTQTDLECKAEAILDKCPTIVLSSITEDGYPRGCVLVKIGNDGFKKIVVSTGTSSRKTKHFEENPKAGICYYNGSDGVTLLGKIRIIQDPEERASYWQNWMIDHFPLGKSDPEFAVLEFTTEEATFWIDNIFQTVKYNICPKA